MTLSFLLFLLAFLAPERIMAGNCPSSVSFRATRLPYDDLRAQAVRLTITGLPNEYQGTQKALEIGGGFGCSDFQTRSVTVNQGQFTMDVDYDSVLKVGCSNPKVFLTDSSNVLCELGRIKTDDDRVCIGTPKNNPVGPNQDVIIAGVVNFKSRPGVWPTELRAKRWNSLFSGYREIASTNLVDENGSFQMTILGGFPGTGTYDVNIDDESFGMSHRLCSLSVNVELVPQPTLPPGISPAPGPGGRAAPTISFQGKCKEDEGETALGCIPTDPAAFVAWVLALAIKIGGGIAFLLMLAGGFTIMTSAGNPEQLNKGKSMITSAVSGLLFIIFSVLLLKIIGIDILGLPGLK